MQTEKMSSKIVFGVMGLVLGLVLGVAFDFEGGRSFHNGFNKGMPYQKMHRMSDGKMMMDSDMGMEGAMDGMMMGLEGKTGDDFDRAFLSGMIMHHQGAVAMAEEVLAKSKRPELINLSNEIISAQTKEIEIMQGWQKAWYK